MKPILLILTVVMCQSVLAADGILIIDENVKSEIRKVINKSKGELTKADLEKVEELGLDRKWIAKKITNDSLNGLAHLTQLKFLKLSNTKITNMALHEVVKCKQIKAIHLNYTQIDDGCIEQLIKLKNLTKLKLKGTKVTKAGVALLKEELPKKCNIQHDH